LAEFQHLVLEGFLFIGETEFNSPSLQNPEFVGARGGVPVQRSEFGVKTVSRLLPTVLIGGMAEPSLVEWQLRVAGKD
jgi:hypothetical protein